MFRFWDTQFLYLKRFHQLRKLRHHVALWIVSHLVLKVGQLIDIAKGNHFRKKTYDFEDLGPKFRSFLTKQPNTINTPILIPDEDGKLT